jgi:hypothetical protein
MQSLGLAVMSKYASNGYDKNQNRRRGITERHHVVAHIQLRADGHCHNPCVHREVENENQLVHMAFTQCEHRTPADECDRRGDGDGGEHLRGEHHGEANADERWAVVGGGG